VICAEFFYATMLVKLNAPANPPWAGPDAGAVLLAGLMLSRERHQPQAGEALAGPAGAITARAAGRFNWDGNGVLETRGVRRVARLTVITA